MFEIIPGILEQEWSEIERKLEIIKPFSRTVHIDILDGKFANNLTFLDPEPFKKYSKDFFFELHMMVENPISYVAPWSRAGFKRFIGHIEKMPDISAFIEEGKKYGEVGIAIDGPTAIDFSALPLENVDCVLVYTSEKAGHSGPPFDASRLEKVRTIRQKTQAVIEVDGGINEETILLAKNAGANCFVSTSYLFDTNNFAEQYKKLHSLLEK